MTSQSIGLSVLPEAAPGCLLRDSVPCARPTGRQSRVSCAPTKFLVRVYASLLGSLRIRSAYHIAFVECPQCVSFGFIRNGMVARPFLETVAIATKAHPASEGTKKPPGD